jgi:hypothetical protein
MEGVETVTIAEVAELLGVPEKTVSIWSRLGVLPFMWNNGEPPISREEFEEWQTSPQGQRLQAFLSTTNRSQLSDEELLVEVTSWEESGPPYLPS